MSFHGDTNEVISSNVVVTVTTDTAPPTIVSALRHFAQSNQVTVLFSELMEPASANVAANYTITNGITVSSAMLGTNGRSVVLTTSPIASGAIRARIERRQRPGGNSRPFLHDPCRGLHPAC